VGLDQGGRGMAYDKEYDDEDDENLCEGLFDNEEQAWDEVDSWFD